MKCLICQQECDGTKGLGIHLRKVHQVNPKDYYDQHLRKEGEGLCLNCEKEVPYVSLARAYPSPYCCRNCYREHKEKGRQQKQEARIAQIPLDQLVECLICHKKWKSLASLGAHIVRTHHMTTKEYYDRHIKTDPQEGFCFECGRPTFFQDLGAGYPNKYCSMACNKAEGKRKRLRKERIEKEKRREDWQTCRICRTKHIGFQGLANHVRQKHGIFAKDYYDAYLKKNDQEGHCLGCGSPTRFKNLGEGYFLYCSNNCYNRSPIARAIVSRAKSKTPSPLKGRPSPRKGKKLPKEHVRNIRIAHAKRAEEHCRKYGEPFPRRGSDEISFMEAMEILSPYEIKTQHPVAGYFIDGYITELNLAIEFDEEQHDCKSAQKHDKYREGNIKDELPECIFWRVKRDDWKQDPQKVVREFLNTLHTIQEST